ncbi:hypothetical protein GEMRC1_010297 [Eukaryota sp. GEM-RC1]
MDTPTLSTSSMETPALSTSPKNLSVSLHKRVLPGYVSAPSHFQTSYQQCFQYIEEDLDPIDKTFFHKANASTEYEEKRAFLDNIAKSAQKEAKQTANPPKK